MRVFADINEVITAQGEPLGLTDWVTIDQSRIDRFADATEDQQWIHLDADRAAEGPFGATIAHGFLSLSLLAHFSQQIFEITEKPRMSINYGLNKVRFLQPVVVGSRVRDAVELIEVKETPKGYLVSTRHTVEIEGQERPALVAESLGLWVP
ncbi:MaoC family dehydratase [Nocardiopsis sp. JB363]|uniref:MaoC family dehydratase n=1 Tax=Nocardiopsis sp. JB363 TaxID=1434837 RepID=UPI000979EFD7|nr:MaoC family dehydratase [Nocardiopsis sp. JB363]SIO91221.1 probable nodulation protein N, MaoC family [Nocardiopsis sp. JB363]